MKICIKCKEEKDESEFYKKKSGGLISSCKKCYCEKSKVLKIKLFENNQCRSCAKTIDRKGKTKYCNKCLEKMREHRLMKIKNKKCVNCNKELEINYNKTLCKDCLYKHNIKDAFYKKQLYNSRICRNCFKLIEPDNITIRCYKCREKLKLYREELIKNRQCTQCAQQIENNNETLRCNKCIKKREEQTKKKEKKI